MAIHPVAAPGARLHNAAMPQALAATLFGGPDASGRHIERAVRPYRLEIKPCRGGVSIAGDDVAVTLALQILEQLGGAPGAAAPTEALIAHTAAAVVENALKHDLAFRLEGIRHPVRPMSLSQVAFLNLMLFSTRELIFGVGSTGTGKTHLAIAAGLNLVEIGRFRSLVITRPHERIEGEIMTAATRAETADDDQLRPIMDVLHDLVGQHETTRLVEEGRLEVTPLGRLRGRTLNECFMVVDEAHNMSVRKMRMAVTRIGRASRMVVTGDPSQADLPSGEPSGLAHLLRLLAGADLAVIHNFSPREIVRNELVARIETLYSQDESADPIQSERKAL